MGSWAKKHHKLVTLAAAILICAVMLLMGTYSWYVVSDHKENDAQLANIESEIQMTGDNNQLVVGNTEDYTVAIENTSDSPAFVRVMVMPICERNGVSLEVSIGRQIQISTGAKWVDGGDGYYYYLGKLAQGEVSQDLFEDIAFTSSSAIYDGLEVRMEIKAEFVGITKYAYRDAWWQGQTPTAAPYLQVDTALKDLVQT